VPTAPCRLSGTVNPDRLEAYPTRFLRTVAAGAGIAGYTAYAPGVGQALPIEATVAGMPRRRLGRTDCHVSIIGYPGFALREEREPEAYITSIREALAGGVNYFDVAPAYADTKCEARMGEAFAAIPEYRRDEVVLACKTRQRTKEGAREELENSLKLLKTDYFDLYQLHCLIDPVTDVEQAFAPGGAMETLLEAQREGKVRYFGFSAHTTRAAEAALQRFRFHSVMFPINFVELFRYGFGKRVLDLAQEQGAAVLAIKPTSAGAWPEEFSGQNSHRRPRQWWYRTLEEQEEIDLALRFTLSQKAVVSGVSTAWLDLAAKSIVAGKNYRPVDDQDVTRLRAMADQALPVFKEGDEVAYREAWERHRPMGPHEGCPGMMV
jgi:aryl-alcohol dehydrogenase-like predicted oxidoreductase